MRLDLICAALVVAAAVPAHAADPYHLAPQTRAAKFGNYSPVAITDFGLAAGTLSDNETQANYAYYSHGTSFSEADFCGTIGAPGTTGVTGISRDSALTYTVGICGGQHFSYIYDQAANTTTALAYPGAITTEAFGVNANGIAVGEWIGPSTRGFSYVEGRYTSVDVAGAQDTFAYGINAQNAIFGDFNVAPSSTYGFIFSNRVYTTIAYPRSTFTNLAGLNSQNVAVGMFLDSTGHLRAFAWLNGPYVEFPLAGTTSSRATGVNENGDVVGWYSDTANVQHGFVWQPSTQKVFKVNAPKNCKFITLTGINDTHAQITGSYQNAAGVEVGFIGTCAGTGCF